MALFGAADLAVAAVVMFVGSTVLSTVGFGIGMSTTPVLLLVLDPQTVVVMINTVSLGVFVLIVVQSREHLPVRDMVPLSALGLAGVPVGVVILDVVSPTVLRIAISTAIIVLALVVAFSGRRAMPNSTPVGLVLAFLAGVLITGTGIGGPLVAIYLITRGWSRHAVRVSLSLYFFVIEFFAVVGYGVAGLFTMERITLILIVAVPVLAGFGLATVLVRRMNEALFRRSVLALIVVTSLMVLGREALEV